MTNILVYNIACGTFMAIPPLAKPWKSPYYFDVTIFDYEKSATPFLNSYSLVTVKAMIMKTHDRRIRTVV